MNIEQLMQDHNFQAFMEKVQDLYDEANKEFHEACGEELPEYKGETRGLQKVLDLPQTILEDQKATDEILNTEAEHYES